MIQPGLKGVIATETAISHVDGERGELIYRGYSAPYLAKHYSFEEVAHLLWEGHLPNAEELQELKRKMNAYRKIPTHVKNVLGSLPKDTDLMAVLRTTISSLSSHAFHEKTLNEQAIHITALLPSIIGFRKAQLEGKKFSTHPDSTGFADYYLHLLIEKEPSPYHKKALETYLILTMDHGLNASTFSARVTTSTESDLISAVTSAIGTMKGPLHGGAPTGVIQLLDDIMKDGDVEKVIKEKLQNGEKLMGFGHRVYRTIDPRAEVLKERLLQMSGQDTWLNLAIEVEKQAITLLNEWKPGRRLYTNVEFYAAAIMKSVQMKPAYFTPTFTASRVVGWTAHSLEQASNNTIFRPQSQYIGPPVQQ
ncbi:citrate synthase/methylcitrate synthase [Radiobacillus kanasensis]|uniref:citrate synthase/methylcitrate synthase n=1 Tax=Radiobacillus kanasensis TaxID=2844358 RepID=UPI001E5F676D|nr:citrate synthase/methylcitrate synthase [Radiobacillus kanasensis]UFT99704.1 citrate synthase/methylcitrate synthase [Radiobacillus kanasensis]